MRFLVFSSIALIFAGITVSHASPDTDFPQAGLSYGGKVRSGPGMQYHQIGSLREGDSIRILTGSGIMMNGYEWFQIQYRNGTVGFQWGGIMCSQKPYPTIFRVCEGLQPYVNDPVRDSQPQQPTQASTANGFTVAQVLHPAGSFTFTGNKSWQEADASGRVNFHFQEQARDEWSVYLYDASRNVALQLDLHRKKVLYGIGNQPKTELYNITYSAAGH